MGQWGSAAALDLGGTRTRLAVRGAGLGCDEPSVVLLTFTPKRRNRRPACSVSSTAPSVRPMTDMTCII